MQDYRYSAVGKAERCLLSALIQQTIKASETGVSVSDFEQEEHQRIFDGIVKLEQAHAAIDMVTVIDEVGMDDLIISIAQEEGFSASLAAKHAQIVHENAMRRAVSKVLLEASRALGAPDNSASSVCLSACDKLKEIVAGSSSVKTRNMMDLAIEAYGMMRNPQLQPECVTTGLRQMDMLMGGSGFKPTNLVVIGARPGAGKSALMLGMAIAASGEGKKVLYISLEMSDEENAQRTLTHISGVSLARLMETDLTDKEELRVGEGMEAYKLENIEHYAASICRVSDIRNLAARMKDAGGLDMICVDYIGLLRPEQSLGSRVNEISQITRDLKALAMELKVVVIAAAQLNRENTKTNRRPQLSDLRESGSIEQDANVVIFVHDDGEKDAFGGQRVELIIAKNRQGQRGLIKAIFRCGVMRFAEVT